MGRDRSDDDGGDVVMSGRDIPRDRPIMGDWNRHICRNRQHGNQLFWVKGKKVKRKVEVRRAISMVRDRSIDSQARFSIVRAHGGVAAGYIHRIQSGCRPRRCASLLSIKSRNNGMHSYGYRHLQMSSIDRSAHGENQEAGFMSVLTGMICTQKASENRPNQSSLGKTNSGRLRGSTRNLLRGSFRLDGRLLRCLGGLLDFLGERLASPHSASAKLDQ